MIREAGIDLPRLEKSDFDDPVRHGHRLRRDLRRHRRRDGSGLAHRAGTGDRREGRKLLRPCRHHPAARLRGRALRRDSRDQGRARSGDAAASLRRLGVAPRRDVESGRVSRHGQRQEGDGGHPAPAAVSASATSSSSWPVPAAVSAAAGSHAHQSGDPRCQGEGHLRGGLRLRVRKSHENPAIVELYDAIPQRRPLRRKSHALLHTSYTRRGKYIA